MTYNEDEDDTTICNETRGPCGRHGCDCGHTIEKLRRQNAELRELVKELWVDVQYESDTATVQRFEPRVEAALAEKETP